MEIIRPIVHETIWGGERLTPYSGTDCKKIGHLYSVIDTQEFDSVFAKGPHAGETLHDWFVANKERYGLAEYERLPILMALLDATEDLSIQVHPDDETSRRLGCGQRGKNESFYTLEPPHSGRMYGGCRATSPKELAEAISAGKIAEMVDTIPCAAGDYTYIEGGTLHAATAGSLHFEIEENAGKTYRFYDYDRMDSNGEKRPLQLEDALASLDVAKKPHSRTYGDTWIEERLYASKLERDTPRIHNANDIFLFAVLLRGTTSILGETVLPGTAVLLEPGEAITGEGCEFILVRPKRLA